MASAIGVSLNYHVPSTSILISKQLTVCNVNSLEIKRNHNHTSIFCKPTKTLKTRNLVVYGLEKRSDSGTTQVHELESDSDPSTTHVGAVNNLGVKIALSILRFYKREISPILPRSCRYVPTCSEYSMEAYKRYGVMKGTVLTGWRLCRCNPLGGNGYDPPRWFGEITTQEGHD